MTFTANDCYVDVWTDADFRGETRRIYGPASHPHLHFHEGDLGDDIGSMRVGPRAFVLAYRGENYQEEMISLGPNDAVADLRELKFDDAIDSLKLINSLKIFERLYGEEGRRADEADAAERQSGKSKKAKGKRQK